MRMRPTSLPSSQTAMSAAESKRRPCRYRRISSAAVSRTSLAALALAFAALLFGASFVVVKDAVATLPPVGFVGWRFAVGAAVLLAISPPRQRTTIVTGVRAGLLLFTGYALQTRGLVDTTASNSGLVTGLYVVLTPLLAAGFARRRPHGLVMLGAAVAFVGLAVLTVTAGFRLHGGDLWTIGGAIAGGIFLAFVETLWTAAFPMAYRDVATFGIIILILTLKPEGLLGNGQRRESES